VHCRCAMVHGDVPHAESVYVRSMSDSDEATSHGGNKVPPVTLAFWAIKIAATTLGETAGDALSMTLDLGYLVSTLIFFALFAVAVTAQIRAKRFHPFLYWAVIVATTTVGTTMADFADRSLGIGYVGGSLLLLALVLTVLVIWWRTEGSISVQNIREPRVEAFYWATILASNTLGTALGDFLADSSGVGYRKGALVFAAALVVVAVLHRFRVASTSILFWAAFILTRPLGATLGDFLTKPLANGGLNLGRFSSSAVLLAVMVVLIILNNRSRERTPGARATA
jgi:uncharacterized membrane-anchored protein